ncbi:DUF6575 domain-containing protein [Paenibacillus cymbidii]|uniref:DUF6575 domain-containing protein n=1 Tax=Paenibacillus cymbidii TaxID=1639034 RepID=UPI001080D5F5|nr:DUF6575 domain-containing protein [Paenibacillus cymbidii]
MDFVLPKPLGELTIVDVFEYIDGPKIFSCINENGQLYVTNWIDTNSESDTWFYVSVNERQLVSIRQGKLSMRDLITESTLGAILEVVTPISGYGQVQVRERAISSIREEELPDTDSYLISNYLEPHPPFLLPKQESTIESAKRGKRDVLDLSFSTKGQHDNEIDVTVLGSALLYTQDLVNFLPQQKKQAGRHKLSKESVGKFKLKAVGCYAASFGVRLESNAETDLFGDTDLSNTLEIVMKLIDSTKNKSKFKEALGGHNLRAIKIYYDFLNLLKNEDVELTAEWASPNEKYMYSRLDRESINSAIQAMNEETKKEENDIVVHGQLVGVNVERNKFNLITAGEEHIHGKISEQLKNTKYTVPLEVKAILKENVEINVLTGKEITVYTLVDIIAR